MEPLKHECGVAMIRLLKPLEYYREKYGTWMYGLNMTVCRGFYYYYLPIKIYCKTIKIYCKSKIYVYNKGKQ